MKPLHGPIISFSQTMLPDIPSNFIELKYQEELKDIYKKSYTSLASLKIINNIPNNDEVTDDNNFKDVIDLDVENESHNYEHEIDNQINDFQLNVNDHNIDNKMQSIEIESIKNSQNFQEKGFQNQNLFDHKQKYSFEGQKKFSKENNCNLKQSKVEKEDQNFEISGELSSQCINFVFELNQFTAEKRKKLHKCPVYFSRRHSNAEKQINQDQQLAESNYNKSKQSLEEKTFNIENVFNIQQSNKIQEDIYSLPTKKLKSNEIQDYQKSDQIILNFSGQQIKSMSIENDQSYQLENQTFSVPSKQNIQNPQNNHMNKSSIEYSSSNQIQNYNQQQNCQLNQLQHQTKQSIQELEKQQNQPLPTQQKLHLSQTQQNCQQQISDCTQQIQISKKEENFHQQQPNQQLQFLPNLQQKNQIDITRQNSMQNYNKQYLHPQQSKLISQSNKNQLQFCEQNQSLKKQETQHINENINKERGIIINLPYNMNEQSGVLSPLAQQQLTIQTLKSSLVMEQNQSFQASPKFQNQKISSNQENQSMQDKIQDEDFLQSQNRNNVFINNEGLNSLSNNNQNDNELNMNNFQILQQNNQSNTQYGQQYFNPYYSIMQEQQQIIQQQSSLIQELQTKADLLKKQKASHSPKQLNSQHQQKQQMQMANISSNNEFDQQNISTSSDSHQTQSSHQHFQNKISNQTNCSRNQYQYDSHINNNVLDQKNKRGQKNSDSQTEVHSSPSQSFDFQKNNNQKSSKFEQFYPTDSQLEELYKQYMNMVIQNNNDSINMSNNNQISSQRTSDTLNTLNNKECSEREKNNYNHDHVFCNERDSKNTSSSTLIHKNKNNDFPFQQNHQYFQSVLIPLFEYTNLFLQKQQKQSQSISQEHEKDSFEVFHNDKNNNNREKKKQIINKNSKRENKNYLNDEASNNQQNFGYIFENYKQE